MNRELKTITNTPYFLVRKAMEVLGEKGSKLTIDTEYKGEPPLDDIKLAACFEAVSERRKLEERGGYKGRKWVESGETTGAFFSVDVYLVLEIEGEERLFLAYGADEEEVKKTESLEKELGLVSPEYYGEEAPFRLFPGPPFEVFVRGK